MQIRTTICVNKGLDKAQMSKRIIAHTEEKDEHEATEHKMNGTEPKCSSMNHKPAPKNAAGWPSIRP